MKSQRQKSCFLFIDTILTLVRFFSVSRQVRLSDPEEKVAVAV